MSDNTRKTNEDFTKNQHVVVSKNSDSWWIFHRLASGAAVHAFLLVEGSLSAWRLILLEDWWRVSYHVNDTYGRVILLRVSIIKHNDSVRVLLHPVLSICRDYYHTMIQLCAVNAFKLNIRLHHSFSLLLHDERKKGAWNSKCHEGSSPKMDPYWKGDPTTIFCSPNTCGIIAAWCASGSNGCVHEFSQYFSSNDGTIMPRWLEWVAAHRSRQSLVFTPFSRLTWLRLSHHLLAVSRSCPITKKGTRCAFL
jgi:hypothetical protein